MNGSLWDITEVVTDDSATMRAGVEFVVLCGSVGVVIAAFQENTNQSKHSFTRPFSSDNDENIEYILFSVDTSTPDPQLCLLRTCFNKEKKGREMIRKDGTFRQELRYS